MYVRYLSIVALFSVIIFLAAVLKISNKLYDVYPSNMGQFSHLTSKDMQDIQNDIKTRKHVVQKTCQKYSKSQILHSPGGRYLNRMR